MKYLSLIPIILMSACASQTSPTGGPKDETPPKLLQSSPDDKTINFRDQSIVLTFDEYVKVQKHKEQIIITPSIEQEYEIIAKKTKVILTFPESFDDSTTYTINFREAIQDITESNPAENLKITFSTGDYLDSLQISGTVYDLLGNKLGDNIVVGLMRNIDTLNIFDYRPLYFTKANEAGEFLIDNVKPATYRLYAFSDLNKNLKADSRNEAYGFIPEILELDQSLDSINIGLIKLDARPLRLNSARQTGTFFLVKLSKGLTDYQIQFENDTSGYAHHFAEFNSAIRIYPKEAKTDSIPFRLLARDSIGNKIDTTLTYKLDLSSRRIPENFEVRAQAATIFLENRILEKKFTLSKPLKGFNFDSIYFAIDSTKTILFSNEDFSIDSLHNTITLRTELEKATIDSLTKTPVALPGASRGATKAINSPQLYFKMSAFISIQNDSSKSIKENPKIIKYENTGTIKVETNTTESKYIVQVLDNKNQVLQESHSEKNTTFRYLAPGDYRIRVLIDKDGDGTWSLGDYFLNKAPEPVYIYKSAEGSDIIKLLANWEIGPLVLTF